MQTQKIIQKWLERIAQDPELESIPKGRSDKSPQLRIVKHTLNLLVNLGIPHDQILQGIGPGKTQKIVVHKPRVTFHLTTKTDPQEIYDRYLIETDESDGLTVVTNLQTFYCVRSHVVVPNGHFKIKARPQSAVQSFKEESKTFANILFKATLPRIENAETRPRPVHRDLLKDLQKIVAAVGDKANEETVKLRFVLPLCRIAGWKIDPADNGDPETTVDAETYQAHRGRLDLLLNDKNIPRIVIECKKPAVSLVRDGKITDDGKKAMEQTHRYAAGVRFWRQRCLPNIMSMVTNGKHAIWFDSSIISFQDAYKSAIAIEISKDNIAQVYQSIQHERVRKTDLSYICRTGTIPDERDAIASSSTHLLTKEVLHWIRTIRDNSRANKEDALAMTLQLLFLTVARDHGILGSEEFAKELSNSNWDKIFEKCCKRFNSNVFELRRPSNLKPELLNKLYEQSKALPFSLEAIPVEYVGEIYENLLHYLHSDEPNLSKTSYYTPQWLVRDVVKQLKPTAEESCIDPTCGSSAFLCHVFDHVTKQMTFDQAKAYLSKKLFGVDRDPLAVQVSRFALLVDLARKAKGDWKEGEHILPKLTDHIVVQDFFRFEPGTKYNIALGNPPWGSIDKEVREREIKQSLKSFATYKDKTDVCIYVIEKAFEHLSANGRLGFLVQRSTIDGVQHQNFKKWWPGRVSEIWDFGSDELFAPRNSALTAVVLGGVGLKTTDTNIVNKSSATSLHSNVFFDGSAFEDSFHCVQGGQAACNEVYELYAKARPSDAHVRAIVRPEVITHGGIRNDSRALFIHPEVPDAKVPKRIKEWMKSNRMKAKIRGQKKEVSRSCHWWLKNRAECARLGWKRLNGYEHYVLDDGQMRIVFPYYLNGERLTAGLDRNGSMIPLTSTTVLIPKNGIEEDFVLLTLAWLNSLTFAKTEAQRQDVKMAAKGGRALYRDYVAKLRIPNLPKQVVSQITSIIRNVSDAGLSEHDLQRIDALFDANLIAPKEE